MNGNVEFLRDFLGKVQYERHTEHKPFVCAMAMSVSRSVEPKQKRNIWKN